MVLWNFLLNDSSNAACYYKTLYFCQHNLWQRKTPAKIMPDYSVKLSWRLDCRFTTIVVADDLSINF